jgi:hypothetical protein
MAAILASNEAKVSASQGCVGQLSGSPADLAAETAFGRPDFFRQRIESRQGLGHLCPETRDMRGDRVAGRRNHLDLARSLAESIHRALERQAGGGQRGRGAFHRVRRLGETA